MVYLYYLEGEGHSALELRTIQDWLIKYELKSVPEVSQVLSIGGDVKQFQILVDPQTLLKYDITISELMERIRKNNQNVGASFITKGQEEYIVRSVGLAKTVEDLKTIVVANHPGNPINSRMSLASRSCRPSGGAPPWSTAREKKSWAWCSSSSAPTPQGYRDLEARIAEINRSLPEGVESFPFYNQASLVKRCFSTVSKNLFLGILLIIIVLFLFMGISPRP